MTPPPVLLYLCYCLPLKPYQVLIFQKQASLLTSKLLKIQNIFGQNSFPRPWFSSLVYLPCFGLFKYFFQIQSSNSSHNSFLEVSFGQCNQNTCERLTRVLFPCMMLWSGPPMYCGSRRELASWMFSAATATRLHCTALDNCTVNNCTALSNEWHG